jgi:hypothetical protein
MTVLTGENDGGKTATLDAIGLLLGSYRLDTEDRARSAADDDEPVEVEGIFHAIDDPEASDAVRIRVRATPSAGSATEILDLVHAGLGARPADLALNDLRACMERLGIRSPGGREKAPHVEAAEKWLSERPSEEFETRWRPLTREETTRLPTFTRFSSVEAPSPTAHVLGLVSREARRLLADQQYAASLVELGERLDRDIAPSLDHVKAKIREYCPDLDAVEIEARFDFTRPAPQINLRVQRGGKLFDLEKSGEGRRRRVALAIHEANLRSLEEAAPTESELIAYDEPDTHLDYASQRQLFEILDRQARLGHVQVIVATHSLNFIDKVPLQTLLHFRLQPNLQTRVEILASEEHVDEVDFLASVCAGLGLRNSVLLDERCFLVVEGDTEEAAIPLLFRLVIGQSLTAAGVTMLNTKGSKAVRRLVQVLVADWRRPVVMLADADARTDLKPWWEGLGRSLRDREGLHFIGTKEFEDAFPDPIWLRVLEGSFPTNDVSDPWRLDELRQLRESGRKFSEDLINLVRRRCRDHTIGKPDLGVAMARTLTCSGDVPDVLRVCFEAAMHIASSQPAPL